jgi:hypothetical protein
LLGTKRIEAQFAQHVEMGVEEMVGFARSIDVAPSVESSGDGK